MSKPMVKGFDGTSRKPSKIEISRMKGKYKDFVQRRFYEVVRESPEVTLTSDFLKMIAREAQEKLSSEKSRNDR